MSTLTRVLGLLSGGGKVQLSDQLIFNKVVAFRGVTGGVGTSTIVQNVAIAMAEKNIRVCIVDTSFLTPVQHIMQGGKEGVKDVDYLEFKGDLRNISTQTKHKNIDVFHLHDRTIVDMLGDKDDAELFKNFLNALKSYYDFILLDIDNNYTQVAATAGIKANKVILVADESLRSVYHIQKVLNTLATIALPFDKMSRMVINKTVTNIVTPTTKLLTDSGLTVLGEIPLSMYIASKGVTGDRIYKVDKNTKEVQEFSKVIDDIVESIYSDTSVNSKTGVVEHKSGQQTTSNVGEVNLNKIQDDLEISLYEDEPKVQDSTVQKEVKQEPDFTTVKEESKEEQEENLFF